MAKREAAVTLRIGNDRLTLTNTANDEDPGLTAEMATGIATALANPNGVLRFNAQGHERIIPVRNILYVDITTTES